MIVTVEIVFEVPGKGRRNGEVYLNVPLLKGLDPDDVIEGKAKEKYGRETKVVSSTIKTTPELVEYNRKLNPPKPEKS